MTPLERLRLAVALGHAAPGAQLTLHTTRGERVVVGHHPAADVSPCELRRLVAASACPRQRMVSDCVHGIEIGGSLVDVGGGVHAGRVDGGEQRWIATLLTFERVAEVISGIGFDSASHEAMHACLKPDPALGATVIAIGSCEPGRAHELDRLAARIAAACFVEELRCAAAIAVRTSDRAGESS